MERPSLRQLEYALAVAEERSFGRAAARCHVSQPGLSAQIAELERRLGIALFERGRAGAAPTPAGAEALIRARAVLRAVDDLVLAADAHRDTVAGVLRVAAIPTIAPYLLSSVARRLRQRWPSAQIELSELRTADLVAATAEGRVDLGLLATPVDTGSLAVGDLAFEPFVVATAEGGPFAGRDHVDVDELADVEILLLEDGHCLREHALAVCRLAGSANLREVHQTGLSVLAQMVAAGDAATLLPASAVGVEARPGSGLQTVPLHPTDVGRTISMVWRATDPRGGLFAAAIADVTAAVEPLVRAPSSRPSSRPSGGPSSAAARARRPRPAIPAR